jgi:hypothetical protein
MQKDKANIPRALREQVWITYAGRVFQCKCFVQWCQNTMTVFDFHVGHDIPESRGGSLDIGNLRPICSRCNLSMGNKYTVTEWAKLSRPVQRSWCVWLQSLLQKNTTRTVEKAHDRYIGAGVRRSSRNVSSRGRNSSSANSDCD